MHFLWEMPILLNEWSLPWKRTKFSRAELLKLDSVYRIHWRYFHSADSDAVNLGWGLGFYIFHES